MNPRIVALSVGLLVGVAAGTEKLTIQPTQIVESRVRRFAEDNSFLPARERLALKLHVAGPAAAAATSYGRVRILEARDDLGNDLRPRQPAVAGRPGPDDFVPIERVILGPQIPTGFDVELELAPAARKASRIRTLKGSFEVLAGGQARVVNINRLTERIGQTIADPALKEAGVRLAILDPREHGTNKVLAIQLDGPSGTVKEVHVLDAEGRRVSDSCFSSGAGSKVTTVYSLLRPLDDTMILKLVLLVGQETLEIAFDLGDLPLP